MADEQKNNPDIYSLRDPATLTETVIAPPDDGEIFAIKNEDSSRFGSIIGITLSDGTVLCDAYRLDKRLSQDEMGETWKASDLQASRNVVVYLPPLEMRTDAAAMEPVSHAARHVEALEHPRIVPLLENFTDPEHGFFVVRKFINGKTLDLYRKEYVKRHKKLAATKAIKILNDIAHALDFAHSVDVVHGDLCTKNLIVGLDDEVYVANFALLPIQTPKAAGKKTYLAPEVVEGQAANALSDVYSLAVVAYELFSGRLPFAPETMDDVPPPIPSVSSTVDVVIRKAMARDSDDRYGSCGAFVKALEKSFHESVKIKPASITSPSAQRTSIASYPLFWATLLCLLFMGVSIALMSQLSTEQPVPENAADQQREEVPPTPEPRSTVKQSKNMLTAVQPRVEPIMPDANTQPTDESDTPKEAVLPVDSVAQTAGQEQSEPEMPQNNGISPLLTSEAPQSDEPVPENDVKRTLALSPADALRAEGTEMTITFKDVEYRFLWCKRGPYMLGTGGFWIQQTPVTQEFWKAVMGARNMREQPNFGTGLPVVKVSWKECEKFIETLNASGALDEAEFQGYCFSLPTEAQWERAVNVDDKTLEWCNDWYDAAKNNRVVRGSGGFSNGRDPNERQGYENVGFRLVIVRKQ